MTVLLIPALLLVFTSVRAHYRTVGREVRQRRSAGRRAPGAAGRLLPIRGWSAITRKALRFALKITPDVYALHIAGDEQAVLDLEDTWSQRRPAAVEEAGVAAPRAHRHLLPVPPALPAADARSSPTSSRPPRPRHRRDRSRAGRRRNWYHYLLHNQTAAIIKAYLLFSGLRRVVVVNVPWYLTD